MEKSFHQSYMYRRKMRGNEDLHKIPKAIFFENEYYNKSVPRDVPKQNY